MITYALTPAFPMILLVAAVVVTAMRRGPVTPRRLPSLNAASRLLAVFRPVGPAVITAAADPEQSLTSAATARMQRHSTRTQTAPSSTSRWTEDRFLCEASAASCGPRLRCGSPDQKTPDRSSGVFLFLRTPQHIQPPPPPAHPPRSARDDADHLNPRLSGQIATDSRGQPQAVFRDSIHKAVLLTIDEIFSGQQSKPEFDRKPITRSRVLG